MYIYIYIYIYIYMLHLEICMYVSQIKRWSSGHWIQKKITNSRTWINVVLLKHDNNEIMIFSSYVKRKFGEACAECSIAYNLRTFLSIFLTCCAYQGVRNLSFSENCAYLLNGRSLMLTRSAFTCSKLIIETLEQGVKYVQSQQ